MAARRESYRSREFRNRPRRDEREADAITVALIAQIVLCALILLSLGISKKINQDAFARVKAEYITLAGSGGESLAGYLDELGNLGHGFFGSVEELLQVFFGKEPPAEETAAESSQDFGYGYLEAQGAADGSIPTQLSGAVGLNVPSGCTLSPVAASARFRSPVAGAVTSEFAFREHPISGKSDFHNGIDIAAEEGRKILAALPGEVVEVGENDIYGKYIILQHATNLKTFYAHCSEIIAREGMAVAQGERIAKVGMTGIATGNHLHFSVIVDGLFTDPFWVLNDNIILMEE